MRKRSAKALAAQFRHQRHHDEIVTFRARDETTKIVRRMGDVGIGEPETIREMFFAGMDDALLDGPEFSCPAGRPRGSLQDGQASIGVQFLGEGSGIVGALVVDQEDAEITRVILRQKAPYGLHDQLGFVACRDDRYHRGPDRRIGDGIAAIVPFARSPEHAPTGEQIDPGAKRKRSDEERRAHFM